MPRLHSHRDRPVDLGPLPTERLARQADAPVRPAIQPPDPNPAGPWAVDGVVPEYRALCARFFDGEAAPARAPVPDDRAARARNLKASAYFLDATLAGTCDLAPGDWKSDRPPPSHSHALVFLVEFEREPQPGEPGADWIRGGNAARSGCLGRASSDTRTGRPALILGASTSSIGALT